MDEDHKKPDGFKIFEDGSLSAESEKEEILLDESMISSDPDDKRTRRPGGIKLFFRVVLVLIMIGAIGTSAYYAYDHVNKRLSQIEATGAHEVADLSKEIDERMGFFSEQFANQHADMQVQIEAIIKGVEANAAALENVKSTQEQALSRGISGLENRIGELDRQLGNMESGITGRMDDVEDRVDAFAAAAETIRKIATEVEALKGNLNRIREKTDAFAERVDALRPDEMIREVRLQLAEIKQEFNQQIEATNNRLRQRTGLLENEISALEAMMKSFRELTLQQDLDGRPGIIEQELQ